MVVIECFSQCSILLVKLFQLIFVILLFKMQKTLVTFGFIVIDQKERGEIRKKNSHVNCLITYMFIVLGHEKKITCKATTK